MNVVIHDLGADFDALLEKRFDVVLSANGAYAPCQGCFHCWTKHPAECSLKDSLHTVCRTVGQADNLTIISRSRYGTYVPAVKNILDRSIGISTPLSILQEWEMRHTLRYGMHDRFTVIAYGEMTEMERDCFASMVERNRIAHGYRHSVFLTYPEFTEREVALL